MIFEIWQEWSTFQKTSQRLADQVRTITKKGWFSDLELREIHQKTLKQNYNAVPDTPSGVKKKQQSNEIEPQTSANESTTLPNDTLSNNKEETLSQEQKVNLENVKRVMNSEKTILPS